MNLTGTETPIHASQARAGQTLAIVPSLDNGLRHPLITVLAADPEPFEVSGHTFWRLTDTQGNTTVSMTGAYVLVEA